jgi:hypothetical protein
VSIKGEAADSEYSQTQRPLISLREALANRLPASKKRSGRFTARLMPILMAAPMVLESPNGIVTPQRSFITMSSLDTRCNAQHYITSANKHL